eukprot:1527178-Pleurochrysis_carterae.AAC.3
MRGRAQHPCSKGGSRMLVPAVVTSLERVLRRSRWLWLIVAQAKQGEVERGIAEETSAPLAESKQASALAERLRGRP